MESLTATKAEDLTKTLCNSKNISKSSFHVLKELNKQIVLLAVFERDSDENLWEHEYIYNLSDNQLIITIYLKNDLKVRCLEVIPAINFECSYMVSSIKTKTPEEI